MRKRRLLVALALASWAAGGVVGGVAAKDIQMGQRYPVEVALIACLDRADFERFVPLAASKDWAAFDRLRNEMIAEFRCVDLVSGVDAYVDDLDRGRACLRAPAATRCLWTARTAVDSGK